MVTLGTAALFAPAARADLADDTRTVAARYAAVGTVTLTAPRFYAGGTPTPLVVPPDLLRTDSPGCTTVTVLGAVSTVFNLRAPDGAAVTADGVPDGSTPSIAGALTLKRCGASRQALAEATVEVRSPRGVLETLFVATTEGAALPEVRAVLPHRDPGIVPGLSRPGAAPAPAPLLARTAEIEARFRREGATSVEQRPASAGRDGEGRVFFELDPGCHRLALLGARPPAGGPSFYDIDAQLSWVSGEVAASDKTESPDATLVACTAERTIGILAFAGSGEGVPVMILHARLPLPVGLPTRWGDAPRARAALALLDRHIPSPTTEPVFQSLGVSGITRLPIEVDPGQCYLSILSPVQGDAKLVSLTASSGARHSLAHAGEADTAVAVTFCVGASRRGTLDIEVHGNSLVWVAALWPMSRVRLGEEAP